MGVQERGFLPENKLLSKRRRLQGMRKEKQKRQMEKAQEDRELWTTES